MKKLLGILLFSGLLFSSKVNAQDYWFKAFDFGFTGGQEPWGIVENDTNIFVLLFAYNKQGHITQNGVTKIDNRGSVVWTSNAFYPSSANADQIGHFVTDIIIAKDKSIYFLSASDYSGGKELVLNKYDTNGIVLWYRTYGKDIGGVGSSELGMALDEDSLGAYITARSSDLQKLIIYHVDSSGDILWNNTFDVPVMGQVGYLLPIIRLPDNSLVVAYDNDVILDYRDYMVRTDSLGSPQQFFTNPYTGRVRDLALHPNGNIVYLSEEQNPPMFKHGGMRIQMLTPTFDTVWSYLYNDFTFPCIAIQGALVRNLSIHPDGRILASVSGSPNCLNLVCFSPEGNLLWEKEVYVDKPELHSYGQALYGAIWTSDGGILVRGYLNLDVPGLGFRQKIFLMKLDSVGCLEPGCASTTITPAEEPPNPAQAVLFSVYPNPAGNLLNVETQSLDNREFLLWLRDSYGRTIAEYTIGHTSQVNISHLAPGIYCATLIGDDGKSQTIRFVKMGD